MIDAFRLTDPRMQAMGHEPRQTTSNLGHLQKPSIQALIHGLGRHYYSLPINYRKNELEQKVQWCVRVRVRVCVRVRVRVHVCVCVCVCACACV